MKLELICLGVGNGMSYVMDGVPSSAFALFANDKPYLLVDCGAGIALTYKNLLGADFPSQIFITHNHMDHAGDLPILSTYIRKKKGIKPKIMGHPEVLEILRAHRFHELCTGGDTPDDKADWVAADPEDILQLENGISLNLLPCRHSYLCFGFILYQEAKPLLAYSADSAFQEDVYQRMLEAPIIILDGRESELPGIEHASFGEIEAFFGSHIDKRVFIVHYESTEYQEKYPHITFMKLGERVLLA